MNLTKDVLEGIGSPCGFVSESHEGSLAHGLRLAERWSKFPTKYNGRPTIKGYQYRESVDFMKGIDDPWKRSLVAHVLENAYQYFNRLDETTRSLAVGNFEKYVYPIIRMTFANLVAADLVSVQPLTNPTGLIFYYDAVAGRTKGSITKGTKLYDAKTGPNRSFHYTDEIIENEASGTGAGSASMTGTASYVPIRPGTFKITDGTKVVTDDGNGALVGDIAAGTNTINYATGAWNVTFSSTVTNGTAVTSTYEYNSEANDLIPEIDIQLTSSPVVTRPNKLRARWAMEAEQDLLATHGVVAETELVSLMTNRISQELNEKIVYHLRQIAPNAATPIEFDITPPTGVSYRDHKEILFDAFVETSNTIFTQTQRAQASWFICGIDVCNVIETLTPHFVRIPQPPGVTGIRKIGTLGDWDIYKDPTYPAREWLAGFKGGSFLDTGYVHAVYQGLVSTPSITLDDFVTRKGLLSRTAQKVVNENFYACGELTGAGPIV